MKNLTPGSHEDALSSRTPSQPETVGVTTALPTVAREAWPTGLITLAGTEMWERFSFYGLQVILAYYLYYSLSDGGLGLPQAVALGIAGSYGGLVYLSQIVGAWIADRVLAPRYVVLLGASAIMAGHLALAFLPQIPGLVAGLLLIVVGTGGLKVNTTSMVGTLYPRGGARRDAGYSIYYMGISIGAFAGPMLTGALQVSWGFHVAFAAAAVGMAIGLTQYVFGMRKLPETTATVANPLAPNGKARWSLIAFVAIALIVVLSLIGVVNADNISDFVTAIVVVAAIGYFVMLFTTKKVTPAEKVVVRNYIPIFLLALVFWTLLFQIFTALTVYADTRVDLQIGSFTVPPSYIITAQGLFVTAIVPALAILWTRSRASRMQSETKLVLGCTLMAVAFLPLLTNAGSSGPTTSIWLAIGVMVIFAFGEALVAPIALSLTAGMAPKAARSQMTGLYFLSMAGGSTLAGRISQLYSEQNEAVYFLTVSLVALAIIAVLTVALKTIKRATRCDVPE